MSDLYKFEIDRDGLHRQLGAGIPKGSIMLLEGKYGAGKSAILQRLTYGFLKNGVTVTYISTELTTPGFIEQMRSLDYPITPYLLNRDLLYIPVFPLIGDAVPRREFLDKLMDTKDLYEREVTIIDSFSSLVKMDLRGQRAIQVLAFFKKLAALSRTIILTVDPVDLDERTLSPLRSDSDIYMSITMAQLEGSTVRALNVNRFGGSTEPVGDAIGFRIEPKIGFIIDITTVA
jgi:archaeal flagellar protein FlaH